MLNPETLFLGGNVEEDGKYKRQASKFNDCFKQL
jgi:hypothetical protein